MNTPLLQILICDSDATAANRLRETLAGNEFVETVDEACTIKKAIEQIGKAPVNTIFIDPFAKGLGLEESAKFIFKVREELPHIAFCLHTDSSAVKERSTVFFEGKRDRFRHYYYLDKEDEDAEFTVAVSRNVFLCISDVRVFAEVNRMRTQRRFYLDLLPPDELTTSLRKFREHFRGKEKVAFLMTRFGDGKIHAKICKHVKETLAQFGIVAVRADDHQFHSNLLYNVQTYLHGCDLGVAVFEKIDAETESPNVAYEVGYISSLRKPLCLLKDKSLKTLQSDLLGTLYEKFDSHDPRRSIRAAIRKWVGRHAFDGDAA